MRRVGVWLLALALVGGAVAGAIAWGRSSKKPETRYETAKVERGRLVAKVTATGTLSALVTVQVGSQVSGRLKEITVDFNSPVKKGQVVARIDPQLFQAAVQQAHANQVAAQGTLTKTRVQAADAKRQYDRAKELADRKLIAVADRDTAQANYDAAEAAVAGAIGSVEQAHASLHQAEINLAYTTIISPIAGVVISRNVDVGQTVAASLQAPTLFTIAEDLAKMQVDTSVAEADVGKLHAGMNASFAVDAYPGEKFTGKVRQVRNAPQTVQNVVTYDAVIDVDNRELKLKPGMTANCTFIYAEKDDVLRVPNAALRFRPADAPGAASGGGGGGGRKRDEDQTLRKLYVLRDGKPVQATVRAGISDGTLTEVGPGPEPKEGDGKGGKEVSSTQVREGDLVITDSTGGDAKAGAGAPPMPMRRMF